MYYRTALAAVTLLTLSLSGALAEDVLELRDGRLLRGQYAGGTNGTLRFDIAGNVQVLAIGDIVALTIGSRPLQYAPPAPPAPLSVAPAAPPTTVAAVSVPAVVPTGSHGTLPIGMVVLMRTKDPIDSRSQGAGSRFTGTLEGDLVLNGTVVVARGSTVYGELKAAKQGGRLLGRTELVIVLTDFLIDGQIIPCTTTVADVKGEGQGKDTAAKVAAGALIGGAADGHDGAKKGAAIGGAAALLSRGGSVKVPPGTLLEFKLEQPFTR